VAAMAVRVYGPVSGHPHPVEPLPRAGSRADA
jgi:hypothetical protein